MKVSSRTPRFLGRDLLEQRDIGICKGVRAYESSTAAVIEILSDAKHLIAIREAEPDCFYYLLPALGSSSTNLLLRHQFRQWNQG